MQEQKQEREKELAIAQLKVEALVQRIKELDAKKTEFRDELFAEKRRNLLLKKKIQLAE